ncbi:MAG: ATP-binding protein [Egibacteraceae bacterium]
MSLVELHLPPDTQFVSLARLVVVTAARRSGMDEERLEDLRIAVSEATTNAILSHQRTEEAQRVVLSFGTRPTDEVFQVTIADAGPGFEPLPGDDLVERDWQMEGGLGITLIRNLADDVEFVRGEGMQVHLRFGVSLSSNGAS